MSETCANIFQYEEHIERAIVGMLKGISGVTLYDQLTRGETAKSPRVEVRYVNGEDKDHQHNFANYTNVPTSGGNQNNRQFAYDAVEGRIELSIITNRTVDTKELNHRRILGLVRQRMTPAYVFLHWADYVQIILPNDIRSQGTIDVLRNEDDLDVSIMSYYILTNVNTQITWPATIED
jgi:hypothetical protein